MENLKAMNVIHKKIGEVILPVDQNGRPQYDKKTIESILLAGVSVLQQEQLISDSDREILNFKIKEAEIAITGNLGTRIAYNYEYHRLTGEPVELSITFDSNNTYLGVDDTINSLLLTLCDIVLSVIHPESTIERASGDCSKGTYWEKYALSLLPQERVT